MDNSKGAETYEDTANVFQRVAARLEGDEAARSLWLKLEQEMTAGGAPSATNYLQTRFKELSDRITAALERGGQG